MDRSLIYVGWVPVTHKAHGAMALLHQEWCHVPPSAWATDLVEMNMEPCKSKQGSQLLEIHNMSIYIYIMDTYTCWCGCLCFQDVPSFAVIGPPNSPGPFALCGYQPRLSITRGGSPDKKNFMVVYGIYKYGIYGSILVYECVYIHIYISSSIYLDFQVFNLLVWGLVNART